MPTVYKAINIDISKIKSVPLRFKMRSGCPNCGGECSHDFKAQSLSFPTEGQLVPVDFLCPGCQTQFSVPARIQNIRLVLAYDESLKKRSNT